MCPPLYDNHMSRSILIFLQMASCPCCLARKNHSKNIEPLAQHPLFLGRFKKITHTVLSSPWIPASSSELHLFHLSDVLNEYRIVSQMLLGLDRQANSLPSGAILRHLDSQERKKQKKKCRNSSVKTCTIQPQPKNHRHLLRTFKQESSLLSARSRLRHKHKRKSQLKHSQKLFTDHSEPFFQSLVDLESPRFSAGSWTAFEFLRWRNVVPEFLSFQLVCLTCGSLRSAESANLFLSL